MQIQWLAAALAVLLLLAHRLLQRYRERLPLAPTCPHCRALTRPLGSGELLARLLPLLADTCRGECVRCGWRGRMRWKWASRPVRRDAS